jgi:tRNA-dihydrouridine synthase
MLAPLEDYSDSALRSLCFKHGADLTFSEMARVEGLVRNNKPTLAKTLCHDSTPVQIQLLAGKEDQLEKYLKSFKSFDGFCGFNLNLSCPSPNVMQQGRGAAMVKRIAKTNRLTSIIKSHNFPVSLKIRLGTNEYEKKHKVYLNSIKEIDADFFIVHAKTASQRSDEATDDLVYLECVQAAKQRGTKIIANGGITTSSKVKELIKLGVDGVMIGRGAMSNPAIFDQLKNDLNFNDPKKVIPKMSELRQEYLDIANKFSSSAKYRENLLKEMK